MALITSDCDDETRIHEHQMALIASVTRPLKSFPHCPRSIPLSSFPLSRFGA